MRRKQVMVRLSETELEALNLLTNGASREEWLRGVIRAGITRRLTVNEAAITQFRELEGKASMRAEGNTAEETADARREKAQYLDLIGEYESENLILYRARGGVYVEGQRKGPSGPTS